MIPAETIGAVCDGSLSGNEYAHTFASCETFLVLICLRASNASPPHHVDITTSRLSFRRASGALPRSNRIGMPKTTANATKIVESAWIAWIFLVLI